MFNLRLILKQIKDMKTMTKAVHPNHGVCRIMTDIMENGRIKNVNVENTIKR